MSELKWGDPPPDKRGLHRRTRKWDPIAEALKEHPGRWALLAENTNSVLAHRIRKGHLTSFLPADSFEAITRKRVEYGKGRCDVYARYVGEAGEHR